MYETSDDLIALQELLDRSRAGATGHLRSIIDADRALTAHEVVELMAGMKVLSLATVTAAGEPRISAVDGHFLHGQWTFGTDGGSAKARHLRQRPSVSIAHIDGEKAALFSHGHAVQLSPDDPAWDETLQHWTDHYGTSPLDWGEDIRMYRLDPTWMVGFTARH